MNVTTIILINGLWVTALCWEHWVKHYSVKGYSVIAANWPGMDGDIEQLRCDPSSFAKIGLTEVVDHYEQIIRELETPPIIIGHGFGGLVTQIILDRGWGAAGVAIASAPVKGIARLPLSMLKLAFSVLGKSHSNKTASLTAQQFHRAFANTLTEAESLNAFRRYVVPSPGRVFFTKASAKFHFAHSSDRQLSERHARAITPGCGRPGSHRAQFISKGKLRAVSGIESRNRLQGIPRANAFHAASGNQSRRLRARLGALSRQWVKANRSSKSDRGLGD